MADAAQDTQRPAPEYINIRHRVLPNGQIDNLNLRPDMDEVIARGGYQALHYYDGVGDGWIEALCPQLQRQRRRGAACLLHGRVAGLLPEGDAARPDGLVEDTRFRSRSAQRLWAIQPLALSQTRIAANITLPVGFSLEDTTITAIVTQPTERAGTGSGAQRSVGRSARPGCPMVRRACSIRAGIRARASTTPTRTGRCRSS